MAKPIGNELPDDAFELLRPGEMESKRGKAVQTSMTLMGIPFPPIAERAEKLKETIQVLRLLWSEEKVSFQGRHYTVKNAYSSPKPA